MLVEELSIWKCVYCETKNDHTNHRCFNCNKKKPSKSVFKRIITIRKNKAAKIIKEGKTEQIKKMVPVEEPSDVKLTFDLSKLKKPD